MEGFSPNDVRVIGVCAHSSAGKTSIIEGILYKAGATTRLGKVDDGTSIADYNAEEKERKVTIYSKPLHCTFNNKSVYFMDTPGYADFFGEVISTLHVVDSCIVVVCGVSGIEVGTQRVLKKIEEMGIPTMLFINKLDKENADFYKVVNKIRETYGTKYVPIQVPHGISSDLKGVIDLIKPDVDVPAECKEKYDEYRNMLIESIVETDDALLEKYLEGGSLDPETAKKALKEGIVSRKIVPIACGAATSLIGIPELMDIIAEYMPSPVERGEVEGLDGEKGEPSPDEPYAAFVFKTVTDPYVGQVTFFRVYSGTIKADSEIYNTTKSSKEKLSQLLILTGKEQTTTSFAGPGDIVAVTKLKNTSVNDTFSHPSKPIKFKPIEFPKPSISFAVKPKSKGDEEKISNGLHRLAEEDHTFEVYRDNETKELVISGMGDLHLEIMLDKLKKKFKVEVEKSAPKIAYKETIRKPAEGHNKYKKQTGGRGQYGEVYLKIEPLERGKGFEFVDQIVGGVIPKNFIPAVEKGILGAMESGVIAGYPVVDLKATVYDGSYHPVDSSEIAFKIAASKAFKEAMQNAEPVLLEPIMNVEVFVPPEYLGDITGDLNGRRGRVMGMDQVGDLQRIRAHVPLAEMAVYSNQLRSITGGRGSFAMEFSHYEEVPYKIAQEIIAKSQKAKEEEEE